MQKIFSLLVGAALSLGLLGLAGCSRSSGPAVNLVTVHFKEASVLETTSEFIIRLSNDAPAPQKFTGSAHKIYINGLYVGKGLNADTIEVPRLGSVTQAITVHLSNLALATRVKAVIEAKSFEYKVQSTFFGDSIFNRSRSETSGKLDLKDFTPTEPETNAVAMEEPPAAPPIIPPPPPETPEPATPPAPAAPTQP